MDITLAHSPDDGCYYLTFGHTRIALTAAELETVALQAARLIPGLLPGVEVQEDEDLYRVPLMRILDLPDRDIQTFLREVQADDLIQALWFMDEPRLKERVLSNMSQRAREMLEADILDFAASHDRLTERGQTRNRSDALESCKRLIAVLHALGETGQLSL